MAGVRPGWGAHGPAVPLTSAVTLLLITAIQAVGISITAPPDGNAVAILTLELVVVTFEVTAVLIPRTQGSRSHDLFTRDVHGKFTNMNANTNSAVVSV